MAFPLPIAHLNRSEFNSELSRSELGIAFTENGNITYCNRIFEKMFEYAGNELVGAQLWKVFQSEAQYDAFVSIARTRSNYMEDPFEVNWRFPRENDIDLVCRWRAQPLNQTDGNSSTLWMVEDIGQIIHQTSVLQKSIDQLEAMMQNAPVGIIVTVNKKLVKANPEFCRMFQYELATALTLSGRDLFPSYEIYTDLGAKVGPLLSMGKPVECEMEMVRRNGDIFWSQLTAYVVSQGDTNSGTIWMITDRSDVKRSENAKVKAMLENQIILDSAAVGIVYLKNRTVQRCNPKAEQIFGFGPGEMIGVNTRVWYQTDADYIRVAKKTYPAIVAGNTYTLEQYMVRADGTPFWCRMAGQVLNAENPIAEPSIWVVEDLTQRHANEQELVSARALMQAVFDSAKVSIIVTDSQGIIRMMNQTAATWLQYDPLELIGHVTPKIIHDLDEVVAYSKVLSDELCVDVIPGFDTFVIKARLRGSDEHEWSYIRRDGSRFPVHLTTSVLLDANECITGYIGVGIDMTDRNRADNAMRIAQMHLEERVVLRTAELASANLKLQDEISQRQLVEEKMRMMAHFDGLTGLPNRNLLMGRLEKAVAMTNRMNCIVGLMFIDLDQFKQVNDSLGHDAGDELLREVSRRMCEAIRDTDTLARHGGDEFVLLVPNVAHQHELTDLANRLIGTFARPFEVKGQLIVTTPSIGIACYPNDCDSSDELLRCSDLAMYQAKSAGKNRYHFFSSSNE